MKKIFFPLVMVAVLLLATCDPSPAPIPESPTQTPTSPTAAPTLTAPPALTATPTQVPTPRAIYGQSAVVAYVKDDDIQLWDEAIGQSETIFSSGDVIAVTVSDDGQVLAFLRREQIQRSDMDFYEQSALWAIDRNGEKARELVSSETLRKLLSASETDSTNIPQMEWIAGTHRLHYSGWIYFIQGEGESHATPVGLYLVDADTLTNSVLLPAAGNNLRFASSPNGQQIALISTTGLGFINADGINYRPEVFPHAPVGFGGQAFPTGVWTQDGQAFLLATYLEKTPQTNPGLAIWRVPLEGTPERLTDAVITTHQDSVTFSPDGRQVAFARVVSQNQSGYFVNPLTPEAGPLIVPKSVYLFWKNLHWSPAGIAYAIHEGALDQICLAATFGILCLLRKILPTSWAMYPSVGFLTIAVLFIIEGARFSEYWLETMLLVFGVTLLLAVLTGKRLAAGQPVPKINA